MCICDYVYTCIPEYVYMLIYEYVYVNLCTCEYVYMHIREHLRGLTESVHPCMCAFVCTLCIYSWFLDACLCLFVSLSMFALTYELQSPCI